MKNKISKILGISVTVAILASMLTVAIPVSAGTLEWGAETGTPSDATTSNGVVAGSDVTKIAVEGSSIYAIASLATNGIILKSTNGGTTWSRLDAAIGAQTTANLTTPMQIAVAPGDANTVLVAGTNNVTAGMLFLLSTDGGTTFSPLSGSTAPFTTINSLSMSPLSAGTRFFAVGGIATGISGAVADIQYSPVISGGFAAWTSVAHAEVSADSGTWATTNNGATLGTASVLAIAFSPNFGGDKVLTAVTTSTTNSTNLELLSFASKKINAAAGFVGYPAAVLGATSTKAAISLAPTYLGADDTLRTAFIGLSTGVNTGGFFRMDNVTKRDLTPAPADIASIAFNGTDLVVGADASNNVYYSANPLAALASVTISNTTTFQRPGGTVTTMTQVAWAGANAVAGTSGASSSFAVSKDKGATFNDVSVFDVKITNMSDLAVSRDGNTVFVASNEGGNTSVWRKTTAFERVLTLPTALNLIIRLDVSGNATNVYVLQTGSTNLWYSNDMGEKSWVARSSLLNPAVDLAVESAQVIYYVTGGGRVAKSSNAGFTFDAEIATGLTTGATITSVRTNQLLVGGSDGTVAWSTDGNAAATTWVAKTAASMPISGWSAANVVLTADNLTNGFIYAGVHTAGTNIIRWQVGTSTSWSDIIAGTFPQAVEGIGLVDGVLYAVGSDPPATTNISSLGRILKPSTAGSTSPTGDWSIVLQSPHVHNVGPQTFKVSTGHKIWEVNNSTTDAIHSFTDTTYASSPAQSAPADLAVPSTNPVTGRAQDIAFTWARLGVSSPVAVGATNGYKLEIALDSAFSQIIFTGDNTTAGGLANTLNDPVVIIVGPDQPAPRNYPFAPGTTYYWRVKAVFPLESLVSPTRTFSFASLAAPFALKGPAVGATNIPIQPILSWSDYAGALWYELTVSEDPTFAIPEFSHNVGAGIKPPTTFYGVTETLKYSTTYYWRVRGVTAEPFVKGTAVVTPAGPWQTGAFTTMADPAKAPGAGTGTGTTTPPPPVVVTVPEVKVVEVPSAPQIVQQHSPQD
jgi:hypothetical protein